VNKYDRTNRFLKTVGNSALVGQWQSLARRAQLLLLQRDVPTGLEHLPRFEPTLSTNFLPLCHLASFLSDFPPWKPWRALGRRRRRRLRTRTRIARRPRPQGSGAFP